MNPSLLTPETMSVKGQKLFNKIKNDFIGLDTKYLLDRYFDLLKKEEETKLREQRIERQKFIIYKNNKIIIPRLTTTSYFLLRYPIS